MAHVARLLLFILARPETLWVLLMRRFDLRMCSAMRVPVVWYAVCDIALLLTFDRVGLQFARKLGGWPYYGWNLRRSQLPSYALWMLLAGVVVLARGSVFMLGPVLEFDGERLTQYCRLESLPGPQDRRRAAGGRAATFGQTLSFKFCE